MFSGRACTLARYQQPGTRRTERCQQPKACRSPVPSRASSCSPSAPASIRVRGASSCARSVGPPLTVQAVRVRQRRRLSGLARIDAGRQQQAYPLAMVARHRLRVLAAARDEAGDVAAPGRHAGAAVAGVQAPPHRRGRIRQRAVRGPLHGHEGVARLHLAGDALAVRQVLIVDAAVSDYTRDAGLQPVRNALPVGTGDHFQAAVFAPGGGQRDPQVEDHGVADLLGQVLVVLVPRHVGGVVLGELHPQHRLRMGQDLRPDH